MERIITVVSIVVALFMVAAFVSNGRPGQPSHPNAMPEPESPNAATECVVLVLSQSPVEIVNAVGGVIQFTGSMNDVRVGCGRAVELVASDFATQVESVASDFPTQCENGEMPRRVQSGMDGNLEWTICRVE